MIDENDLHLAAIVAVDGARRVEAGDAVIERQPRARPHLRLMAFSQRNGDAGGDEHACAGRQIERLIRRHRGEQVEAGGMRIAQMVIASVARAALREVPSLERTDRGAGGFGSTGG